MSVANLSRAEALLEIGRPRDALAVVGSVLAGDSQDVDALLVAARCHLELAEPRYAVSAATAALAQAPGYPDAWMLASAAYMAADDPDRAAWHAQQLMTRWPQLSAGYRAFASARINQVTYGAQVRSAAAQVMEMEPLDPESHVLAAQAEMYPRLGRPHLSARRRARAHLVRALELDPHNVEALQEIATLAALGWGFARGLRGSAEVLQISPFEQAPLGAVAYIFRRLIWLVHLLIIVAFFGCMFASFDESFTIMRVFAGSAALAMVLLLANIRWQLGRSAAAHLRAFPGRDSPGIAWLACLVLAVICLNLASWVPGMIPVLALAKILIWVGAALSWVPQRFTV